MNIAVTGGSGAIGTYVCDELANAGHNVICLDVVPPRADVGFRHVDLTNLAETCKAADGFEQIVHLAAIGGTHINGLMYMGGIFLRTMNMF